MLHRPEVTPRLHSNITQDLHQVSTIKPTLLRGILQQDTRINTGIRRHRVHNILPSMPCLLDRTRLHRHREGPILHLPIIIRDSIHPRRIIHIMRDLLMHHHQGIILITYIIILIITKASRVVAPFICGTDHRDRRPLRVATARIHPPSCMHSNHRPEEGVEEEHHRERFPHPRRRIPVRSARHRRTLPKRNPS